MSQLDLFNDMKNSPTEPAIVFGFPLDRRIALVRSTAQELLRRSYNRGRQYWAGHVKNLRRELRAEGRTPEQIDAEISRFSQAVRREIHAASPKREARR